MPSTAPLHATVLSNPPQAVALPQTPAASHPLAAGVRAPITGTTPKLSTADLAQEKPLIVPRPLNRTDEPAPPVPAIKPAPKAEQVASKTPAQPLIVPRTALFPVEFPLQKASETAKRHPLAQRDQPEEPSFEMPVMVHPKADAEKPKAAVVLSPPIAEPEKTKTETPSKSAKPKAAEVFNPFAEFEQAPKTPATPQPQSVAKQEAPKPAVKMENLFEAFSKRAVPKAQPIAKKEAPKPAVKTENLFEAFSKRAVPKAQPIAKKEAPKPAVKLENPFEAFSKRAVPKAQPIAKKEAPKPAVKTENPFEAFPKRAVPKAQPIAKKEAPKPAVKTENPFVAFPKRAVPKAQPIAKQEAPKPARPLGNPFQVIPTQSAARPKPAEKQKSIVQHEPKTAPAAPAALPSPLALEIPAPLPPLPRWPVGLEGCCPVTLRDRRVMVPGKAEHATEWQGVTYRFVSAQAQAEFEARPEHYAPAKSGRDVIVLATSGQQVAGSLQHAVWYHRQLYLFQNSETMASLQRRSRKVQPRVTGPIEVTWFHPIPRCGERIPQRGFFRCR